MTIITVTDALSALPASDTIHVFVGSTGADWDRSRVIEELTAATRIAWVQHWCGHDLAIEPGPNSRWRTILFVDARGPKEII